LILDDGTKMSQSVAILRYLGQTYKGRNGETLYPAHADPMLSWKIDNVIDWQQGFLNSSCLFFFLKKAGSEEYNDLFVPFITTKFPAWLQ
jgi:glutathione S-transferase